VEGCGAASGLSIASSSISVKATSALRTGTRAASTACRRRSFRGWAMALVTRTNAAAPPATYEEPHRRTHPAGEAASEAFTSPRDSPSPSNPTWTTSATLFSSSSSANIGPRSSEPTWCNRPIARRSSTTAAATAARSFPRIPSLSPT
jgi:hypothetical protein